MANGLEVIPFIEADGESFRVGATYANGGDCVSSTAVVSLEMSGKGDAEPTWIVICTDSYEGYAMLPVETIPKLIEALTALQCMFAQNKPVISNAPDNPGGETPS